MNPVVRDLAILFTLLVGGLLLQVIGKLTGRDRRERRQIMARREAKFAPIPGLAERAASLGWTGPATGLGPAENSIADYVREMFANLCGYPRSIRASGDIRVDGPLYANMYSGQAGGRAFLIGNLWMGFGGEDRPGSLCVIHLGEALPPLFVNLRGRRPYVRLGLKEIELESDRFNRTFQVLALDRRYAMDIVSERAMDVLMERDDWVFFLEIDRLVCLCASSLNSVQDFQHRLDALTRFADLIPRFVEQDRAVKMPTLPDGTVLDIGDPASREKFTDAFVPMTPEQREQVLAEARTNGVRFLAGMFGKDLPPGVLEEASQRLAPGEVEKATGMGEEKR